nr:MAG TPA: hypothetical protein [Caudoviricetes sp.]
MFVFVRLCTDPSERFCLWLAKSISLSWPRDMLFV